MSGLKTMIALSESSPQLPVSASLRDIEYSTEAARIAGWEVHHIPQELPDGITMDDAMWHVPAQAAPVPGIWIGYIPLPEHYERVYSAAEFRNIRLLNTPDQFRCAEEFDRFYPAIADLTAESRVTLNVEEAVAAAEQMGYPVFIKGAVQSLKAKGVEACVAHDPLALTAIANKVFASHRRSLGKVIVRKLLPLRHTRVGPAGFPLGREYRVFVYRSRILSLGYYWEGEDELAALSRSERQDIEKLAATASERIGVPYLSIDIGQKEDGEWVVIEVGDGQFSGTSQTPIHQLWSSLTQAVSDTFSAAGGEVK